MRKSLFPLTLSIALLSAANASGAMTYHFETATIGTTEAVSETVACPGSRVPVSGGFEALSDAFTDYPEAIRAHPTRGGFRVTMKNRSFAGTASFELEVVCAGAGFRKHLVRTWKRGTAPPASETTPTGASAKAKCRRGTRVLGGGVKQEPEFQFDMYASRPADGPDRDRLRDDAWSGTVSVDSPVSRPFRVVAICVDKRRFSRQLRYLQATEQVPPGNFGFADLGCPIGRSIVGGGGATEPAASSFSAGGLEGSTSFDSSADGDSVRDNVWQTFAGPDASSRLSTYVICR